MSGDTSFTKLFSSITKSTVWCEPHTTLRVWITMLADCDRRGEVHGTIPGLANMARVTITECEAAIATFLAPDPYSRTPDHEGRRIELFRGGWRLLNYNLYREKKDEGAVREQKRDYNRRSRAEESENSTCGKNISTQGNESSGWKESGYIAEAEAEADTSKTKNNSRARSAPLVIPEWLPADVWQDWHEYRNSRKGWTQKARELSIRTLTELWTQGQDPRAAVDQAIERGWTKIWPVHGQTLARAGPNGQPQSKTLSAIQRLEGLKNGLADTRTDDGLPEVALLGHGSHTRD